MAEILEKIGKRLAHAKRLWLFLDYDSALDNASPMLEYVSLNPEGIALLAELVRHPRIRVAVISSLRLAHLEALVPVPGILLAGTCGVELRTPEGERINRVAYDDVRQVLDVLKPHWLRLIAECEGFSLEDRLWTLALHARFADEDEAQEVWAAARRLTTEVTEGLRLELFRMPRGHKSLEITPKVAHKGRTVEYVLDRYPLHGALPVYFGENDEEVFGVVRRRGGITILVSPEPRKTKADCRLASPQAVLYWLQTVPARFDQPTPLMAGEGR